MIVCGSQNKIFLPIQAYMYGYICYIVNTKSNVLWLSLEQFSDEVFGIIGNTAEVLMIKRVISTFHPS